MNGEIKTYKVNGKTYDIPPEREQEFLSEFKDAVELKSYIVNKDTFDIPVSKEVDFLKDFPDAQPTFGVKKKDEVSSQESVVSSPQQSQLPYSPAAKAIIDKDPFFIEAANKSKFLAAPINLLTGAIERTGPDILDVFDGAQRLFYKGVGRVLQTMPGGMVKGAELEAEQKEGKTWFEEASKAVKDYAEDKMPDPMTNNIWDRLVYGFGSMIPMLATLPLTPEAKIADVSTKLITNFAGRNFLSEYSQSSDLKESLKAGLEGVEEGAAIHLVGFAGGKFGGEITKALAKKAPPQIASIGGATAAAGGMGVGGFSHNVAKQIANGVPLDNVDWNAAMYEGEMFVSFGVPGIINAATTTYINAPKKAVNEARLIDKDVDQIREYAIELEREAIKETDPKIKAEKALAADIAHKAASIKAIDQLMTKDPEGARKMIEKMDVSEAEKKAWIDKVEDAELTAEYQKQLEQTKDLAKAKEPPQKPSETVSPKGEGKTPPKEEKPPERAETPPVGEGEVETREAGKLRIETKPRDEDNKQAFRVTAYNEKGEKAAMVDVGKEGDAYYVKQAETAKDQRRKGVMTSVYDYIEKEIGKPLEQTKFSEQTDAGDAFLKSRKAQPPKVEESKVEQPIAEDAKKDVVISEPPKKPPKPPKPPSDIPGENVNPESPKEIAEFRRATKKEKADARGTFRERIIERRVGLDLGAFDTSVKVHEINKRLKPHEREAVSLLIEKAGVPESMKGTKVEEAYNKPSREVKKTVKEVEKHFEDMWEDIVANTDKLTSDQIKDYVTHIWDIPKNKVGEVVSWFSTKNRFLKKRYISSLKEGMDEFGLKPKTLDIGEIMRIHSAISRAAIENNKFLEGMKDMDIGGMSVMMKADKAPNGYVEYKHPALTYNKWRGESPEGKPITTKEYYKIHPDMKSAFDVLFSSSRSGVKAVEGAWWAWEVAGNYLKKTALSASLFHHAALTETALANAPLNSLKVMGKDLLWDTIKNKAKDAPAFKDPEMAREAIKDGVQLGASQDFDVGMIQKHLDQLTSKAEGIPGLKQATKALSKFNKAWDSALWEYIHDGYKLYTHHELVSRLDPSKMTPESYKQARREIAQFVNDSFGGQNWDVLMISPTSQRLLRSFLLSPDWTVSTIRQAMAPTGLGALYKNNNFWKLMDKNNPVNVRRRYGQAFWLKAALIFGVGMNAANIAVRKKDVEENPQYYPDDFVSSVKKMENMDKTSKEYRDVLYKLSMMNNSVGHKTHLFVGRYEDGSERNLRWGKQFREFPELIMDDAGMSFPKPALKKIGGKAAPQLQLVSQMFTGKTMSGYESWDLKDREGWDFTLGVLTILGRSLAPYSSANFMRGDKAWTPLDLMMPSSKGMTTGKAVALFLKGIEAADPQYVSEVYESAVRNNLDAYTLFSVAMNERKATLKSETSSVSNDIKELKIKIKEESDSDKKDILEEKISYLLEKQDKIKEARELHDEAMDQLEEFLKVYNKK